MAFQSNPKRKRTITLTEKEYLKSEIWKCENSPTGGHWWNCNCEPAICTICGKTKNLVNV